MKAERDSPDNAVSTGRAQGQFLEILNKIELRVLQELHDEPLNLLLKSGTTLQNYDWASLKERTQEHNPVEPALVDTRKAIEAWASPCRWNLSEPWILTAACESLEAWRQGSTFMGFHKFGFSLTPATPLYIRERFPEQIAEHFQGFMGWEPTAETASQFTAGCKISDAKAC